MGNALRKRRIAAQRCLRQSIEYFSSARKRDREKWVCRELLLSLGIPFNDVEICSATSDPPDVNFRDAKFEIKEILDTGRRRHAEYKSSLAEVLAGADPIDLHKMYSPKEITLSEIGQRVGEVLKQLESHYAPAVRNDLDALLYVNLTEHWLKPGDMPPSSKFKRYGWRTVSAVYGGGFAMVFFANSRAPTFLQPLVGQVCKRAEL